MKKLLQTGKRAEMGIGTLIIFIAMILVAAIAAGVLLQTANTLQSKALLTGERTRTQVSTSARAILLYAENGTDSYLDDFFLKMKLAAGSDAIAFADTLIEFDTNNQSGDLEFAGTTALCERSGAGFSFDSATGLGTYSVEYLVQGSSYKLGYLQRGDVVKICFPAPRGIGVDEDISISVIPKVGHVLTIETATPDIISQFREYIFP